MNNKRCRYPHCSCAGACLYGGSIPKTDPKKPKFDRARLVELAERHDLATTIDANPGFHLSNDDMEAIAFSLRFTAEKL